MTPFLVTAIKLPSALGTLIHCVQDYLRRRKSSSAKRVLPLLPRTFLLLRHIRPDAQLRRSRPTTKPSYFFIKLPNPRSLTLHRRLKLTQLSNLRALFAHSLVKLNHQQLQLFSCQLIKSAHKD
ncbi:MAG: hypothetical protein A2Z18_06535 [Armatimonadetes bacterium RBG_16_58_9]|nr:MAG: hypothetical protein A2Z18_06535 [Armatimonadetes bacterium RBG_16_58_9]